MNNTMEKKFIERKETNRDIGYLVMTRKIGEEIAIGDDILITIIERWGNQVRLGIYAPKKIKVIRPENTSQSGEIVDGNR